MQSGINFGLSLNLILISTNRGELLLAECNNDSGGYCCLVLSGTLTFRWSRAWSPSGVRSYLFSISQLKFNCRRQSNINPNRIEHAARASRFVITQNYYSTL